MINDGAAVPQVECRGPLPIVGFRQLLRGREERGDGDDDVAGDLISVVWGGGFLNEGDFFTSVPVGGADMSNGGDGGVLLGWSGIGPEMDAGEPGDGVS